MCIYINPFFVVTLYYIYDMILYDIILYDIILHYITLYYIMLYCIILYYIILYYVVLLSQDVPMIFPWHTLLGMWIQQRRQADVDNWIRTGDGHSRWVGMLKIGWTWILGRIPSGYLT